MPERVKDFMDMFAATHSKIASFEGCKSLQLLNDIELPNVFFISLPMGWEFLGKNQPPTVRPVAPAPFSPTSETE